MPIKFNEYYGDLQKCVFLEKELIKFTAVSFVSLFIFSIFSGLENDFTTIFVFNLTACSLKIGSFLIFGKMRYCGYFHQSF